MKLGHAASKDVALLNGGPEQATYRARYGVLLDDSRRPVSVAERGGAFFPAVMVAEDMSLAELCEGDGLTLLDLDPPGLVVVGADKRVVGVLPVEVVDAFVPTHTDTEPVMGEPDPSDRMFGGAPRLPTAMVKCVTAGCGYVNELTSYDPEFPERCQNPAGHPHPLEPGGI